MFDFLAQKFSHAFTYLTGQSSLSEGNVSQALAHIKEALIQADVPLVVVDDFLKQVSQEAMGQKVLKGLKPHEQFVHIVHKRLTHLLGGDSLASFALKVPERIMLVGVQGAGKTTTLAKLCWYIKNHIYKDKKISILVASVDFQRPAAIDQLELMAQKAGVDFIRAQSLDALQATRELMAYAQEKKYDIVFLDTAGRMHVDEAMIHQLKEIETVFKPTKTIMILDAMTGQQSLAIARVFCSSIAIHGALLTKLDSGTKAGAAFACVYDLKKPIWFLGYGEKIDDLEVFKPERVAQRMIGMGDVQSLVERADALIKKEEQERAQKAFFSGQGMTLEDFLQQLHMLNKLGSFSQLMGYIPGMSAQKLSEQDMQKAEKQMVQFKAIIQSMTRKERVRPALLNGERKKRIARGAGVSVQDVALLLQRFEQMQQFAKLMKNMKQFPKFF